MASQVRILTLEDGEDYKDVLYRVKKGWTIQFSLGTTLLCKDVKFFCNYPSNEEEQFERTKFNTFNWWVKGGGASPSGFEECYTEVNIKRAGVYQFYIVKNGNANETTCHGSFVVDPSLKKAKGGDLKMDAILMQTVLCKLLGTFPEWKKQLALAYETGYNMLHFSPIQELGQSNSSYSIRDHHKLNPKFSNAEHTFDVSMMEHFVQKVHKSWNMFSIIDVVWNHAANDSPWVQEHPESGYNLKNTPHMRPAFLVDRALWYLNTEIMKGRHTERGVGKIISKEDELHFLATLIREALDKINLKEFFTVDEFHTMEQFKNMFMASGFPSKKPDCHGETLCGLKVIQDKDYKRFGCSVDIQHAVKASFQYWDGNHSNEDNMDNICNQFKSRLHELNEEKARFVDDLYNKIVHNTIGHVRYHFIDSSGPQYGEVTHLHSISVRYFSYPFEDTSYDEDSSLMETDKCTNVMAHNGWVMGFDATKNFAESDSMVYINRELIAWGDSIKLNYGNCPDDSPFLWGYMKTYTEDMAKAFHGFRIDNCHSTPIHVAEYLLDCARNIRPDLYVVAELFTNNEATDNRFINRLGINSLIRENMGAHNPRDLGRHVHRYGGDAVGSFMHPPVRPLHPSMAHAIFMDLTHDNKSPFECRSVFDMIPSSALVAATSCATGSTRGYDELVPHHIHVVNESRQFRPFGPNGSTDPGVVKKENGIVDCKDALNELHSIMCEAGYNQLYVDQLTEDVCAVTRHSPTNHGSIIFVAHNAFNKPDESCYPSMENKSRKPPQIPNLKIQGVIDEVLLEARLLERKNDYEFQKDEQWINGNDNYLLQMHEHFAPDQSKFTKLNHETEEIEFTDFIPGSIVVYRVSLRPGMKAAVERLRYAMSMFPCLGRSYEAKPEAQTIRQISEVVKKLSLIDLNRVLYRCGEEEKSEGWGGGIYTIPGCGDMVYCGLQGFMSYLSLIRQNNDLGHPLCENLRRGNWIMDYIVNRLKHSPGTSELGSWFEDVFKNIGELPRYLIPAYFDAIITGVYTECLDRAFSLMSRAVQEGSIFYKHLALGSLQMFGESTDSMPAVVSDENKHVEHQHTMAAGLPHFSHGFMRCWGRDTFISLRGLFLLTERFDEAKTIILSFAGCLRHGLIPNLLASGTGARYNSRDATWFWLRAIQDYCNVAPEGNDFLRAPVVRMYTSDSSEAQTENQTRVELQDIIQEVLQRHFEGVEFRERNAGPALDRDMSSDGFNQSIGVCKQTGFVYGGNENNCGTWMDKMGSSEMSKNKGHPATPRDGSAVEIVGLCKSALNWLIDAYGKGQYRYSAVSRMGDNITWSYEQWNESIQNNFEAKFYVSKDSTENMVHKREIYKDTYGSKAGFTDFQLRPNFPIAMCAAPELFVPEHAVAALSMIEKHLLGPIGLKTLDPDDWKYDGNYENSLDCDRFDKAKGFNYHQGPEWTWVLGPFLRAKIYFSQITQSKEYFHRTLNEIRSWLLPHYRMLMTSPWRGLPELTNKDGAPCYDSCPTQAWSMACLLEVLEYIKQVQAH